MAGQQRDRLRGCVMREVTQTRTGFPAGNCTEATLASLLGVDIDEVPALWSGDMGAKDYAEAQPPERMAALLDWLEEQHGVRWVEWRLHAPCGLPISAVDLPHPDMLDMGHPHVLVGPNPDGVPHMVVGQGGEIRWDPNPLRRGITSVTHIGALVPVAVAEAHGIHR